MGAAVFASAFWIALPMVAMLLFVNLVLGIALPEPKTDAQRQAYAALAQAFPSFDARQHAAGQGATR